MKGAVSPRTSDGSGPAAILTRLDHLHLLLQLNLQHTITTPTQRLVHYLTQRQGTDGSWQSTDYPPWSDVLTAIAIDVLRRAGYSEESTWVVTQGSGDQYEGGLSRAIAYLGASKREDGWGEDVFDTCRVLRTLQKLRSSELSTPAISCGIAYVARQAKGDFADSKKGDWFGVAFYAMSLEVLTAAGGYGDLCNRLLRDVIGGQHPTGYFGQDAQSLDLRIWHTAICLLVFKSLGLPGSNESICRAEMWLEGCQDAESGSWGTGLARLNAIYTAYAILALEAFSHGAQAAARGKEWLLRNQDSIDGRVLSLEGSVMAGLVLTDAVDEQQASGFPATQLSEIDGLLQQASRVIQNLTAESAEAQRDRSAAEQALSEEASRYLVRLSHKQAALLGLLFGILGVVIGIIGAWPVIDSWRFPPEPVSTVSSVPATLSPKNGATPGGDR